MNSILQVIYLWLIFKKGIYSIVKKRSIIYVNIDKNYLSKILIFLKLSTNFQFKQLLDITAVDYIGQRSMLERFALIYVPLSLRYNSRLIIKTFCSEEDSIESVSSIFPSASWLEREVWDMFGLYFFNQKDLRRILSDYGFQGFPLRKDFPLSGFFEVRYDDEEKRIVLEPLEVTQEFRYFTFSSPWRKI